MTPRNIFNIILKVLGIFFIKDFLMLAPQLLSVFWLFTNTETMTEAIWTLLGTAVILLIYWFVFYYLIFKTELIIDQLHLDKGFDQDTIPLNIHHSSVLRISVIVIGGLLAADGIPEFCRQLFSYFQEKRLTFGMTNPSMVQFIIPAVKIVIGIFLMSGQRQIVNFIELRQRKKNTITAVTGEPTKDA